MDALSTLLRHAMPLNDTKYYSLNVSGDWAYSIMSNDTVYFYLVQSGSFRINIGDISRTVHAGEMIMVPNSDKHICHALDHHGNNAKPLQIILSNYDQGTIELIENSTANAHFILVGCQYDKEIIQPLLSVLPAILPDYKYQPELRFEALNRAIGLLTQESEYERLGRRAMIDLWANIVLIECLRTHIENLPETTDNWLIAMKDPYLSKTLTMMHDKPNYSWTTHELAEKSGMSRSSFTKHFKDIVGIPPLTYLIEYRLRIAARHLRLQKNSIGHIGELIGYGSNSTFSQAFKRAYGMSPKAYRQQHEKIMA